MIREYDWNYTSIPNENLAGNKVEISQGRVFGGGSAINGMAYCRGASSVFDTWANLSGNPGLAWHSILQDFQETTKYSFQETGEPVYVNTTGFGNGPIQVSQSSGTTGFDDPFAQALQSQFDVQQVDMTDGTGIGLDLGLSAIQAGTRVRSYARNTIGSQIIDRPNLRLVNSAWVNHIGFLNLTAVNVTYVSALDNNTYTIKSNEIIISAGAINTPKLLMLSGVGPAAQLSSYGIPLVSDIPAVGTGLYDHAFAVVEAEVDSDIVTFWQVQSNSTESAMAQREYSANSSGPLGWNNGFVYAAFRLPDSVWDGINSSHYINMPADRPHILVEYSTVPFKADNRSAVTVWASLVQPESSGTVTLSSANYLDDPLISTNFYGTPADRAAILYAYKQMRSMLQTNNKSLHIVDEFYPGAGFSTSDDDQMWSAIQNGTFSFHHPMGTVAMGQALERNWRIRGLNGIRVVDSSAFPSPPSCHTQSSVYAMANRAAKDIISLDNATATLKKNCKVNRRSI